MCSLWFSFYESPRTTVSAQNIWVNYLFNCQHWHWSLKTVCLEFFKAQYVSLIESPQTLHCDSHHRLKKQRPGPLRFLSACSFIPSFFTRFVSSHLVVSTGAGFSHGRSLCRGRENDPGHHFKDQQLHWMLPLVVCHLQQTRQPHWGACTCLCVLQFMRALFYYPRTKTENTNTRVFSSHLVLWISSSSRILILLGSNFTTAFGSSKNILLNLNEAS